MLLARLKQQQQHLQQQQQQNLQQQQFQQQQFQQQQPGQQYPSSQGVYNMVGPPGQMGQSLIRPMQQQQQQPQPIGMVCPQSMPTQHLNFLLANMISEFEFFFNDILEKRNVWLFRTISNCYYMLFVL